MITKISLKSVASCGTTPAILETNKRVNLMYGLNGTGKTTMSRYLAKRDDAKFSNCSLEGVSDEKILVYDHDFIESNFYETDEINGIFTLSSANKNAEEKIKHATEEIGKIDLRLEDKQNKNGLMVDLKKEEEKLSSLISLSEQKVWEIKDSYYGGDRILEFCLDDYNKKDKSAFFNKFLSVKKPSNKPKRTIEELKEEAQKIQGAGAKIYDDNDIQKILFDFSAAESDPILSEVIIGNENSTVAAFIKQLKNSDWVKLGLQYLPEIKQELGAEQKNTKCPFCQKETITPEFYIQIKNYFDDVYEKKIEKLKELEDQYWSAWSSIPREDIYLDNPFIKNKEKEFKLLYKNLYEKLRKNWSAIKEKREDAPAKIFDLELSSPEVEALNKFFEEIIAEIRVHNKKVRNKNKHKKEITNEFWEIMRWEYDPTIAAFTTQKKSFDEEIKLLKIEIKKLESDKQDQTKIIEDSQKETVNIDGAIININSRLRDLGIDGFEIGKASVDLQKLDSDRKVIGNRKLEFYKLKRDTGANEDQFKTLSEGEKTIISFLYFLELCKGKESESEIAIKKIIVIDDPISSLSHLFIFNVSQLIKHTFFDDSNFQQIFVLTHSLYFFHELIKIGPKEEGDRFKFDGALFRIFKKNGTCIQDMKQDEIQNDYQSYWKMIKDHNEGNASDALLAVSMRNILEFFFGFIEKAKFNEAIIKIDPRKYQAFIRYVNRESHSDFVNISDTKEINTELFKEAFKEVFLKAGYENHFHKMISS